METGYNTTKRLKPKRNKRSGFYGRIPPCPLRIRPGQGHHALLGNQGIPPCCQQSGRRLDRLLRWADGGAEQTAGHAAGLREKGRISGGAGLLLQRPLRRDWAGPPVKRPSRCSADRRAVPGKWPDQGVRPHKVFY